jgi:ABC-type sugar transport system permease subunit
VTGLPEGRDVSVMSGPAPGASPVASGQAVHQPRRTARRGFDFLPYLLVSPLALFVVGLALVPASFTVVEAFLRVNSLDPPVRFIGLGNFAELFGDPALRAAAVNTAGYVLIGVGLSTVLGIAMAITLQHRFAGRSVLIAILILPWALPGVVEGIAWSGIWDANTGLLNSVLTSLRLIDHYHVFLGDNRWLTIALIELVQVWQITPLSALLVLASLQNVPGELYEAARLDGCSIWQAFWRVTLPLARPGIAVAMVQAVIATLNVFDQPYVLNGAARTGASVMTQTYFISFQNLNFGAGYALSLMVTIVTLVLSLAVVKLVYRAVEF